MLIDSFDTDQRVFVVAEIGNNHEGDVRVAEDMIRRAAAAGVDAVKFQTIRAERLVSPENKARFEQLKRFELTSGDFYRLAEVAREEKVHFLSTPFDIECVSFLNDIVCAFKIASGDNTFLPLIDACAQTGKPILLSSGLATIDTLRPAVATVEKARHRHGIRQQMAILHCVAAYPVPPEQANLAAIGHLRREFDCTVGYSDHTLGIETAALSVAAGARIVEKHFTLDKSRSEFRDHQLSADPADLAGLIKRIRNIQTMLGAEEKVPQPCEEAGGQALRRSIAARRDLPDGMTLGWEDLIWLRPGGGIPPGSESSLIGRTLKRSVRAGEAIHPEILAGQPVGQVT